MRTFAQVDHFRGGTGEGDGYFAVDQIPSREPSMVPANLDFPVANWAVIAVGLKGDMHDLAPEPDGGHRVARLMVSDPLVIHRRQSANNKRLGASKYPITSFRKRAAVPPSTKRWS